jgi:hypothetical protein
VGYGALDSEGKSLSVANEQTLSLYDNKTTEQVAKLMSEATKSKSRFKPL